MGIEKKIDVKDYFEKFEIKKGELYFNNKKISSSRVYPFDQLLILDKLSRGKTGITFICEHKLLKVTQVIKICIGDDPKKLEGEAQKNSNTELSDAIAIVFDAGKLDYPENSYYSAMGFVAKSITFEKWLNQRKKLMKIKSRYNSDNLLNIFLFQMSVNMGISILNTYSIFVRNKLIHGDLNPRNILIMDKLDLQDIFDDCSTKNGDSRINLIEEDCTFICNRLRTSIVPGEDKSDKYLSTKFIDVGTSKAVETTKSMGENRDVAFLIETIGLLIDPFFKSFNLSKTFNYDVDIEQLKKQCDKGTASSIQTMEVLFRILAFITVILGHVYNKYFDIDVDSRREFYQWSKDDIAETIDTSIHDWKFNRTVNILSEIGSNNYSKFIKWDYLLDSLIEIFPGVERMNLKI